MNQTIDDLFFADYDESLGLAGRFDNYDPESVSLSGIDMPQDDSVSGYIEDLETFGTEMARGAVGAVMPGEFERFGKAIIGAVFPDADESRVEAFIKGIEADPEAFSAEDFYEWTGQPQGDLPEDVRMAGQLMGELLSPTGLLTGAIKKAASVVPKVAKPAAMAAGIAGSAMAPAAEGGTQNTSQYRDTFVNYLMENENAAFASGKAKTARHKSPEGGRDTVGFGHKLTAKEEKEGKIYGIPIKDIDVDKAKEILIKDIKRAATQAKTNLKSMHPNVDFDSLSEDKKEMLTDIQFNVKGGGIKTFPNFVKGVVTDDVGLMKKEYKRYYTTAKGAKREVKKRNTDFFNMYLKSL